MSYKTSIFSPVDGHRQGVLDVLPQALEDFEHRAFDDDGQQEHEKQRREEEFVRSHGVP
jgi:hypothetical protein